MKKSLSKAVAISATCAAGLAGALATSPVATADQAAAKSPAKVITNFGMKADVFGTKVLLNGVELKSLKTGYARQNCTRVAGVAKDAYVGTSALPLPQEVKDLIKIDPISNTSETYRTGARTGVVGVSKLPAIRIGGTLPDGTKVPALVIEGLVSKADAFHSGATGKFGTEQSFDFAGIDLDYDGTVVEGTPLEELLDILNQAGVPVEEIVNQVIDLLVELQGEAQEIVIPGLGTLSLGKSYGQTTATSAVSEAYALKIAVDPENDGEEVTMLQLGRAASRITGGATSGIFNSQLSGLSLLPGDILPGLGAIRLGGISQVSMPCSGTGGKVLQKTVSKAGIPGLFDISGVTYRYMGKQLAKGRQSGFVETRIGDFSLPAADLTIKGLVSRVTMFRKPYVAGQPGKGQTKTWFSGTASSIQIGDQVIDVKKLKVGDEVPFDGGVLKFADYDRTFHGARMSGLVVELFDTKTLVELGITDGYANKK